MTEKPEELKLLQEYMNSKEPTTFTDTIDNIHLDRVFDKIIYVFEHDGTTGFDYEFVN